MTSDRRVPAVFRGQKFRNGSDTLLTGRFMWREDALHAARQPPRRILTGSHSPPTDELSEIRRSKTPHDPRRALHSHWSLIADCVGGDHNVALSQRNTRARMLVRISRTVEDWTYLQARKMYLAGGRCDSVELQKEAMRTAKSMHALCVQIIRS